MSGRRRQPEPTRRRLPTASARPAPGVARRTLNQLLAHPTATGGGLMMVITFGAIVTNATALQDGHHPAPLWATRPFVTAPAGVEPAPEAGAPAAPAVIQVPAAEERTAAAAPVPAATAFPAPVGIEQLLAGGDPVLAQLQQRLAALGYYDGTVDGITGPRTERAIAAYQEARGLAGRQMTPTELIANMDLVAASQPGTALAEGGDARLLRIQQVLNQAGFGPIRADGLMGEETRSAIRDFERYRGLAETGEVSDRLMTELGAFLGSPIE